MAIAEVKVPQLSESVAEATMLTWKKKVGDSVAAGIDYELRGTADWTVPGNVAASEIIARIFDTDEPMPPEKAHKPLTERQKALMKRWVEQGAVYEPHWAYAPLKRPALPTEATYAHCVTSRSKVRR